MKKLYTFFLASAVFLGSVILCFSVNRIDGGENIIVQRAAVTQPLRGGFHSTEGYLALLPGETVNINTADIDELMKLPGIGEVLAQRIIDYRTTYGKFSSIGEITQVADIGEGRFEAIRLLITTED